MKIDVYSDGSAQTADKPGGYGWVMVIDGEKHSEGSGHLENVSNNDMELWAAIQGLAAALKYVNESNNIAEVTLCSDSQIVLGWTNGSYRFKQESKIEKYKQLQFLRSRLNVKTKWIKGHSGDEHNERCDKLANDARKGIVSEVLDKSKPKGNTKIGVKRSGVVALWYDGQLKIVDFETGVIENYDREMHGKRGSAIEIRKEKSR